MQGFDISFYYMYTQNMIIKNPIILAKRILYRPILFLLLILLNTIIQSKELTFFLTIYFMTTLYAVTAYIFVNNTNDNILFKKLITLTIPLSFLFIRLSYDLLGNFLVMSFTYLFLSEYIRLITKQSNSIDCIEIKKRVWLLILSLVIITTHIWVWAVLLVAITIMFFWDFSSFLSKTISRKKVKNDIFLKHATIFLNITLPNIVAVYLSSVIFGVTLIIMPRVTLFDFLKYIITFGVGDSWLLTHEATVVYTISILGFTGILIRYVRYHRITYFEKIIVSWAITISFIALFVNFSAPYRFYLLYPVGFLSGIGMYILYTSLKHIFKGRQKTTLSRLKLSVDLTYIVLGLVWIILFASTLGHAYIPEYVYRPDNSTMEQIKWLNAKYGFGNESTIFLIFNSKAKPLEPKSSPNVEGWVRAYLGNSAYFGSLLTLLEGMPDKFGHKFDTRNKTIILANRLYDLTVVDYLFVEQIEQGIYKVEENITLEKYLNALTLYSKVISRGYNNIFHMVWQSENINFVVNVKRMILVAKLGENQEYIKLKVDKDKLTNHTFSYFLMKVHILAKNAYVRFTLVQGSDKKIVLGFNFANKTNADYWILLPFNGTATEYLEIIMGNWGQYDKPNHVLLMFEKIYIF